MSDVSRVVETVFRVTGTGAAVGALGSIGSAAAGAKSALSGIVAPLTAVMSIGGGIAAARGLIAMQSAAEGTRQAIAGALSAFGAVSSFNEGLQQGADVMQVINREAAALPGSAEDYVEVFRTALPAAMSSGFRSITDIAHFTNQMTAIASANQEASSEAAMDMSRLLQGRAGVEVRLWRTLQPLIGKSAEQFNHMSAPARAQAMQGAIHRYSDTLSHMGDTWDAIYGTTTQYLTQMTRAATMPLFDAAKHGLSQINDWLGANQDKIESMGRAISEHLVNGFRRAGAEVKNIFQHVRSGASSVGGFAQAHAGTIARIGAGLALGPTAGMAVGAGMAAVRQNPGAFAAAGERLMHSFTALGDVLEPLEHVADSFNGMLGQIVVGALPGMTNALTQVMDGIHSFITTAWQPLANAFSDIGMTTAPLLGSALGGIADFIGSQVHDALVDFGETVREVSHWITNLMLTIENVIDHIKSLGVRLGISGSDIGGSVSYAARQFLAGPGANMESQAAFNRMMVGIAQQTASAMAAQHGTAASPAAQAADSLDELGRSAHGWGSEFAEHAAAMRSQRRLHAPAGAAARGGAHTVNDFRHSRFDIMQKFAEGFDPDRIAIAFAHDLEHTADRRLSGQLEPQFTVR